MRVVYKFLVTMVLSSSATAFANTLVGSVPGEFAVSPGGAATYNIPIELPKGAGDAVPAISVSYNSQSQGGNVGIGWSLQAGVSSITRCPHSFADDGKVRQIQFDQTDKLCLDGQKLVVVSGSYGAAGSEYRTIPDSGRKVVQVGATASTGVSFVVYSKDGRKLEYGDSAAGAVLQMPESGREAGWLINRSTNRVTRSWISYSYDKPVSNAMPLLTSISYGSPTASIVTSVTFEYRSGSTIALWQHGEKIFPAGALSKIAMFSVFGKSEYRFNYRNTDHEQRKELVSVVRCVKDVCLRPTTFDYKENAIGRTWETRLPGTSISNKSYLSSNDRDVVYGDWNGDSLTDMLHFHKSNNRDYSWVALADGYGNFTYSNPFIPEVRTSYPIHVYASGGNYRILTGDWNGDGLTDLMHFPVDSDGSKAWVGISNGNGNFTFSRSLPGSSVANSTYLSHRDREILTGDWNGDGRTDLLHLHPDPSESYSWVGLSNGDGTFTFSKSLPGASVATNSYLGSENKLINVGDWNGDGLADLLHLHPDEDSKYSWVAISKGDGSFDFRRSLPGATVANSAYLSEDQNVVYQGDWNGDGLVDLAHLHPDPDPKYSWVAFSKGNGTFEFSASLPGASLDTKSYLDGRQSGIQVVDWNADGRADMLHLNYYNNNPNEYYRGGSDPKYSWVALSNGDGSFNFDNLIPQTNQQNNAYMDAQAIVGVGDFNGDGQLDMVQPHPSSDSNKSWISQSIYRPYGQLETIEPGIGDPIFIQYTKDCDDSRGPSHRGQRDPGYGSSVRTCTNQSVVRDVLVGDHGSGNSSGFERTEYQFWGMRRSTKGRGMLGFEFMSVANHSLGVVEYTQFHHEWPLTGNTKRVSRKSIRGSGGVRKDTSTCSPNGTASAGTLSCSLSDFETIVDPHGVIRVLPVYQSTALSYVDVDTDMINRPAPIYSRVETHYDSYDDFGNALSVTVDTLEPANGNQWSKISSNSYYNDEENWLLARLTESSITHSSPAGTTTKKASFEYDFATGQLSAEITEPDQIGTAQYKRVEYDHDLYGRVIGTRDYSYDYDGTSLPVRQSSSSYGVVVGVNGQWVKRATVSNGLGHESVKETSLLHGGVLYQRGPNHLATQYLYDDLGREAGEIRADSTETVITRRWAELGDIGSSVYKVISESDGQGATEVQFDSEGRVVRKVSIGMDGREIFEDTVYDIHGRVAKTSRRYYQGDEVHWAHIQLDELGHPRVTTRPDGAITSRSYNGLSSSVTDALGRTTTTVKNAIGKVVEVIDAAGGSLRYEYSPAGELVRTTDPEGQVITMTYDSRGRKTSMVDPDLGAWSYAYDGHGDLRKQVDAKNQETILEYDVLGRMVARFEEKAVDTSGSLVPSVCGSTLPLPVNQSLGDSLCDGESEFETNVEVVESNWVYDHLPGETLSDAIASKSVGKLVEVFGDGIRESYTYDQFGRQVTNTVEPDGESFTTATEYDNFGRVSRSIRPDGFVLENVYNDNGYLVAIRSPVDQQGDYDADYLKEILDQSISDVALAWDIAAEYEGKALFYLTEANKFIAAANYYSQRGAPASETNSLREKGMQLQASANELIDRADQLRIEANQLMEDTINLAKSWLGDSHKVQFAIALITLYRNERDAAIERAEEYLAEARATAETNSYPADDEYNKTWSANKSSYFSRASSAIRSVEARNEDIQSWEYIVDISSHHGEMIATNLSDDSHYSTWWRADQTDVEGRVARQVYGNGLLSLHHYNEKSGQLENIYSGHGLYTAVQVNVYTYDLADNVLTRSGYLGGDSEYQYDQLGRITSWDYQGRDGTEDGDSWQYDAIGNIQYSDSVGNYTYGEVGNAKRLTETDLHGTIVYDGNGNILTRGTLQIAWTSFNKPSIIADGDNTSEFRYGPSRARFYHKETTVGVLDSSTRETWYSGGYEKVVSTRNGETTTQHKNYLSVGGDLIGVHSRNGNTRITRYFHRDALGSIDVITDHNANIVERYRYRPFGEQVVVYRQEAPDSDSNYDPLPLTNRGYTGHEHLKALSLIHMNGRVYDPTLGRFLSPDPNIQAPYRSQNYSRYAYVMNNPLKYTDPSGYFWKKVWGQIGGLLQRYQWLNVVAQAVVGYFTMGLGNILLNGLTAWGTGASTYDIASAAIIAGVSSAATMGIGHAFTGFATGVKGAALAAIELGRAVAHGAVQGLISEATGGKFKDGFVGGFAGAVAGHLGTPSFIKNAGIIARTLYAAAIGGTVSAISGGSFKNGAASAAFVHLLNAEYTAKQLSDLKRTAKMLRFKLSGEDGLDFLKMSYYPDYEHASDSYLNQIRFSLIHDLHQIEIHATYRTVGSALEFIGETAAKELATAGLSKVANMPNSARIVAGRIAGSMKPSPVPSPAFGILLGPEAGTITLEYPQQ